MVTEPSVNKLEQHETPVTESEEDWIINLRNSGLKVVNPTNEEWRRENYKTSIGLMPKESFSSSDEACKCLEDERAAARSSSSGLA